MKSILLSIQPQWVARILNGEKTIEIRRKFPKDYVGWVYIYCTKGKSLSVNMKMFFEGNDCIRNGKVCCRFWCDKVEELTIKDSFTLQNEYGEEISAETIIKKSCVRGNEIVDYVGGLCGCSFYAIHISKLEVFDRPRELSEFRLFESKCRNCPYEESDFNCDYCNSHELTNAPQNFAYIESEN